MVRYARLMLALFLTFICLTVTGCSESVNNEHNKITVAVSIVPQETFVKKVAGDLVNIVTLIPPGYSPTNYQPNPQLMEAFSKASLYFSIGVPTEEANILPKVKDLNPDMKVVKLADHVGEVYPHRYFSESNSHIEHEKHTHNGHKEDLHHHHEGRDPHIWLSPKRVMVMVDVIAEELSALDSENRVVYKKNAQSYKRQLEELDKEIKETLKGLKNRTFIVYHPSFGYFADDYGLTMLSLEEGGKEATAESLQKIIDKAKNENIKVIFYQSEIDSRQSRTFAEEIGGKAVKVQPLAPNYIENLREISKIFASVLRGEG